MRTGLHITITGLTILIQDILVSEQCQIHVYNNYYDGNSKYGVGAAKDSEAFVEANYFRHCNYPMLSSMQGSDVLAGGIFSGENGGVIKAYNNYMEGQKSVIYANSDAGTTTASATDSMHILQHQEVKQYLQLIRPKQGGKRHILILILRLI